MLMSTSTRSQGTWLGSFSIEAGSETSRLAMVSLPACSCASRCSSAAFSKFLAVATTEFPLLRNCFTNCQGKGQTSRTRRVERVRSGWRNEGGRGLLR